jgi:hypothetical protein
VVVQVHGDIHGEAEEARPQLGNSALQQLWLRLEQGSKEVAVPAATAAAVTARFSGVQPSGSRLSTVDGKKRQLTSLHNDQQQQSSSRHYLQAEYALLILQN